MLLSLFQHNSRIQVKVTYFYQLLDEALCRSEHSTPFMGLIWSCTKSLQSVICRRTSNIMLTGRVMVKSLNFCGKNVHLKWITWYHIILFLSEYEEWIYSYSGINNHFWGVLCSFPHVTCSLVSRVCCSGSFSPKSSSGSDTLTFPVFSIRFLIFHPTCGTGF